MNGSLQWGNERNPYRLLYVSGETARVNREEGGDDVKSAWPSDTLGYTHDTMAVTESRQSERKSKSHKDGPSSDRGLQLDLLKPELLVIAGQPYCGEYVLESCTHRPSTQGSRE